MKKKKLKMLVGNLYTLLITSIVETEKELMELNEFKNSGPQLEN